MKLFKERVICEATDTRIQVEWTPKHVTVIMPPNVISKERINHIIKEEMCYKNQNTSFDYGYNAALESVLVIIDLMRPRLN